MDLKEQAASEAVRYVEDGMVVGLGSGSTASVAIRLLGERAKAEDLDILGVPTSKASDLLGRAVGIRIVELDDHPSVDLTIDGADEIDPRLATRMLDVSRCTPAPITAPAYRVAASPPRPSRRGKR